ncbi:MAG: hypothetical protein U1E43_05990 [Rhodospirillales bacterium]
MIVNTCAVTGEAVRQARQTIRKLRRSHPDRPIIVTGCAAQLSPQSFAAMPEDRVLGNVEKLDRVHLSPDVVDVAVADIMTVRDTAAHLIDGLARGPCLRRGAAGDHRCTFCIIPFARGPARSTPTALVERCVGWRRPATARSVDRRRYLLMGHDLEGSPARRLRRQRCWRSVPSRRAAALQPRSGGDRRGAVRAAGFASRG